MKNTKNFGIDDIIVRDLENDYIASNEPIRCNHFVFILCNSGNMSLEINYTNYILSKNMLLVISPFDIVSLKHGSDDFKCNAVVIPTAILNNLFADVDISKYESLKKCRIVLLEDGFYFYFVQAIALLKSAKQLVSQEKFNLVAEKQVVSLIQMLKHYNSTFQSNVRNERKEYSSRKNELFKKFIHELISSHSVSREVLFYANELGVSCGYLNEVCNEVSSHSAKEIIDSAVAARLKYELSYTGKTIQELSDEYNFPSQSYFSRYYKRMTGMSPSEFRKKRQ